MYPFFTETVMEVFVGRCNNPGNWDEALENFKGGLFMTTAWLSAISKNDRKPVCLKFYQGDKLVAVAGGIEVFFLSSQNKQLLFYSGIASRSADPSLTKRCKEALYNYARKEGYQRITLKSYDNQSHVPVKTRNFRETQRLEYVFDLHKNKDTIIKSFDKDLRRRVRKAKREGVVFRKSNSPELTEQLFKLIDETYNIRQSKGYSNYYHLYLPFFNRPEINELINNANATFYIAEREKEILSMQLVLTWGKRAYGILMGTSSEGYKVGAPSVILYEISCTLKDQDYLYYNIGGVPRSIKHIGVRNFKDTLGATRVKSAEEVTNFINPPRIFLNPLLYFKWFLEDHRVLPWQIKKPIIHSIDRRLKKRDPL